MSLLFNVAELRREIISLKRLARDFLDLSAPQVLAQTESALTQICMRSASSPVDWGINSSWPLKTRQSRGEFQPARTSRHNGDVLHRRNGPAVHGEVTFVWQVLPERDGGSTKKPAQRVRLIGKASTRIRIVEGSADEPGEELAMWRMEVADDHSPGAYFHVQVLGRETDRVFPHHLDVPRLPNTLVSPFACTEYLLAELFQDAWRSHANRDVRDVRDWHGVQSERLHRQLRWHIDAVTAASGSPWSAWKQAVPPEDLFV